MKLAKKLVSVIICLMLIITTASVAGAAEVPNEQEFEYTVTMINEDTGIKLASSASPAEQYDTVKADFNMVYAGTYWIYVSYYDMTVQDEVVCSETEWECTAEDRTAVTVYYYLVTEEIEAVDMGGLVESDYTIVLENNSTGEIMQSTAYYPNKYDCCFAPFKNLSTGSYTVLVYRYDEEAQHDSLCAGISWSWASSAGDAYNDFDVYYYFVTDEIEVVDAAPDRYVIVATSQAGDDYICERAADYDLFNNSVYYYFDLPAGVYDFTVYYKSGDDYNEISSKIYTVVAGEGDTDYILAEYFPDAGIFELSGDTSELLSDYVMVATGQDVDGIYEQNAWYSSYDNSINCDFDLPAGVYDFTVYYKSGDDYDEISSKIYTVVADEGDTDSIFAEYFPDAGVFELWGGTSELFSGYVMVATGQDVDGIYEQNAWYHSYDKSINSYFYLPTGTYDITLYYKENNGDYAEIKSTTHTVAENQSGKAFIVEYFFNTDVLVASNVLDAGDVNGDGVVNVNDATLIQKYGARSITLDDDALEAADVNYDGEVNINDATLIQKYSAMVITEF